MKPGPKSVRLEGNKDAVARVKLEVKDGVLTTQVERGSGFFNKRLEDVRLYVTSPRVESVAASGGAELSLEGRAEELRVTGSGGSVIEAGKLRTGSLQVTASGGTRVEASPEHGIEGMLSGGSTVKASRKPASVQVNSSGGSQVRYE